MSDPQQPDPFQGERSTIGSLGERKRWRLFGRDEARETADEEPETEASPFVGPSMIGTLARRSGPEPPKPESARKSFLSLGSDPAVAEQDAGVLLVEHSTLAELAGLEERAPSGFPIERGILISLLFHVILLVLLLTMPAHIPTDAEGGLLAALVPAEKQESPIPILFHEAPGPARPNPKQSPPSDADRRAAGGDPSRPKSHTPFVPPSRGVAGLAPGARSPRVPGADAGSRRGAAGEAERRASAEQREAPKDAKPSDFPSDMRPQLGSGPREISKLAGLDRAIREAARGTVAGEGGSPSANPEGGFVDTGGISFETSWYDWGPYAAEMVRRIKLHWIQQPHWKGAWDLMGLGAKGRATIRFTILADGHVASAEILRPSEHPPFTNAALKAILTSDPFRPLPKDLLSQVPGKDREKIVVTFLYNIRPEDLEAEAKK